MEGKLGDVAGNVVRKISRGSHLPQFYVPEVYLPRNKRLVKVLHEQGIWIRVCVCVKEIDCEREGDPIWQPVCDL